MRLATALLLLCGCHAGNGPPGTIVYARGTFEGSEGVFTRRIGGHEHRLLRADGSTTVQPSLIDSHGRVIYSRDADDDLCPDQHCHASHPNGYYWIDPAIGTEHFLMPFNGGNMALVGDDRIVYHGGDAASLRPELRSVKTDGSDAVLIHAPAWLCGATNDGRVAYVSLDDHQLVIANADGGDPHVLAEEVDGGCDRAQTLEPTRQGFLPDGRLVFHGRPAGGGEIGEYVAALDGTTRLITTDDAAVLGETAEGRFAIVTYVPDDQWPGQERRDRVEILTPGSPPLVSLDIGIYNTLVDITPTGHVIVAKYDGRADPPYQDYYAIGADGALVPLATAAMYTGTTADGRVIFEQRSAYDRTDLPARGSYSIPETGGTATRLSIGRPLALIDGWVVVENDGLGGSVLGSVTADGARRHTFRAGDVGGIDLLGGDWIGYRDGDDLRVARVDGSEDDFVAKDAAFPKLIPDPTP